MSSMLTLALSAPSDTRQDAINKIDREIEDLEAQILSGFSRTMQLDPDEKHKILKNMEAMACQVLALKSTRNTVVPIASLHREILQEIFIRVIHWWNGTAPLSLSWICRSWRQIALQTAGLWSYIDFRHPTRLQEALTRSKDHELDFRHVFHLDQFRRYEHLIPVWQMNMYRIKSLTIQIGYFNSTAHTIQWAPAWITPAPRLVKLNLQYVKLPPNLFAGFCPSLRSLQLTVCYFSWSSLPVSAGMTEFHISCPSTQISVVDYVNKLHHMAPTLQEFSLLGTILLLSSPPHFSISAAPPVYLSCITAFRLFSQHAASISALLERISFPESLDFKIDVSDGSLTELFALSRALVSTRGLHTWPVTYLSIQYEGDEVFIFKMETQGMDDLNTRNIRLTIPMSEEYELSDLLAVFDVIPISAIPALDLCESYPDDDDMSILDYFSRKGTVHGLDLEVSFVSSFVFFVEDENRWLRKKNGDCSPRDWNGVQRRSKGFVLGRDKLPAAPQD